MKGLIAIDLDGTLFDSRQQISSRNISALRKTLDLGYQTAIVTGRGKEGAMAALDMVGLQMPVICSAGSLVLGDHGSLIISARTFQIDEELTRIADFARNNNAGLIADSLEENWWFGPDKLGDDLDPLTAAFASSSIRTCSPEMDLRRPLLKLTLAADPEVLQTAEVEVGKYCPSLHYVYAGLKYLDFTRKDVSKGTALKILAEHLGIRASDTIAIGDQLIDLSMLEYSGLPIAMATAPDKLKDVARWIAPANDEDGVAWALDRIINGHSQN